MTDKTTPGAGLLQWISESDALPRVAQFVLFAVPRQSSEFWGHFSCAPACEARGRNTASCQSRGEVAR